MARQRSEAAVLITLSLVAASTGLMHTGVVAMIPELPEVFGVSIPAVSWVATISLVLAAVANPVVGRLADTHGPRRLMMVLLSAGVAGSILAALAPSFGVLLVARVLQGPAVGCVPLAFAISQRVFRREQFARAIAIVSAISLAIGTGFGPLSMGFVLDLWGWRAVFAVVATLGAISLIALIVVIPATRSVPGPRFDVTGALGLGIVLTAGLLAVSRAPDWGWTSPVVIVLALVSAVGGMWWWRMQRRSDGPLVDLAAIGRADVAVLHGVGVLMGFVVFALYLANYTLVSMPADTGHGLGAGASGAGWSQLPGAIGLVLTGMVLGRRRSGSPGPVMLAGGLALMGAGFAFLVITHARLLDLVVATVAVYVGMALAYSTIPVLLRRVVSEGQSASSNAFNALARTVGSATATSISAALLGAATVTTTAGRYPADWGFIAIYLICALGCLGGVAGVLAVRSRGLQGREPGHLPVS